MDARLRAEWVTLFRGMPVAYHGKNPAGFLFHLKDKLQS